jgi:hypothetical protein
MLTAGQANLESQVPLALARLKALGAEISTLANSLRYMQGQEVPVHQLEPGFELLSKLIHQAMNMRPGASLGKPVPAFTNPDGPVRTPPADNPECSSDFREREDS